MFKQVIKIITNQRLREQVSEICECLPVPVPKDGNSMRAVLYRWRKNGNKGI